MANFETLFVKMIKEIAAENGITIRSFDDWAFCLEKDSKRSFIYGYQFGLDKAAASQILKDKAAASEMMAFAGIPCIPHKCVMSPLFPEFSSVESSWDVLSAEFEKYGPVVIKDNQGTGGRNVFLARTKAELEKAAHEIFATALSAAVCPFVDIKEEYRVILLDGHAELCFMKQRPFVTGDGKRTLAELIPEVLEKNGKLSGTEVLSAFAGKGGARLDSIPEKGEKVTLGWKHNLGQGASPLIINEEEIPGEVMRLASSAAKLFGLRFASADIVDTDYGMMIMEINGGVMMENIAASSAGLYKKARSIYEKAVLLSLEEGIPIC